nr:MAG TPA: hypothetical protein [Crassvirales sp.]
MHPRLIIIRLTLTPSNGGHYTYICLTSQVYNLLL